MVVALVNEMDNETAATLAGHSVVQLAAYSAVKMDFSWVAMKVACSEMQMVDEMAAGMVKE